MTDESALLSDQVFPLNTLLWALEELPDQERGATGLVTGLQAVIEEPPILFDEI